jgi:hypothetical protein
MMYKIGVKVLGIYFGKEFAYSMSLMMVAILHG